MKKRKFTMSDGGRNCLSHWYPQIRYAVPTPETFFVRVSSGWDLVDVLEGGTCWYLDSLCNMLQMAAEKVGTPCFLRTGQGSGKHDWSRCCHVTDADKIMDNVLSLVEWSHVVDMMGLPHDVWVVREMLPTKPVFRCSAYGGMPVVREWRYFVEGPKVLYGIPYWPEGALEQGRPDDPDWRRHLEFLHTEPDGGEALASATGRAMRDSSTRWSVDVLDCDGQLYVTDMALASNSWGWDADREMK